MDEKDLLSDVRLRASNQASLMTENEDVNDFNLQRNSHFISMASAALPASTHAHLSANNALKKQLDDLVKLLCLCLCCVLSRPPFYVSPLASTAILLRSCVCLDLSFLSPCMLNLFTPV